MSRLLILIIISICAVGSYGQGETLTNEHIVEMTRAGLSSDILLRKIRTSNAKFDVSTGGLIELKKAMVPDEVISEMIERQELIPPNENGSKVPAYSENGMTPNSLATPPGPKLNKSEIIKSATTIALEKSSAHPSRQALEKELLKRQDFRNLNLTITRYKDSSDLYVEIGYVSLSWLTHRYVYRIYDRRSGTILAAGETTSWGSLAENLARHISRSLVNVRSN